jgi:hypothetical protein
LARAKNTDRAEARRRHREQTRAASAPLDEMDDGLDTDSEPQSQATGARGMFKMPDFRDDLRTFPGMVAHSPKLWIPFAMLIVAFVFAVMLTGSTTNPDGTTTGVLPSGFESIVSLYVQLTLPPTALFVFFIGGFLTPRSSWLMGAVLGVLDGVLWSLLFLISPDAQPDAAGRVVQTDMSSFLLIIVVAVVIGILGASFASWYRNFLRSSQERARQNRAAREQQQKVKAKEDARAARSAQRQPSTGTVKPNTSAAATPKPNTLSSTSSTPPSKR